MRYAARRSAQFPNGMDKRLSCALAYAALAFFALRIVSHTRTGVAGMSI